MRRKQLRLPFIFISIVIGNADIIAFCLNAHKGELMKPQKIKNLFLRQSYQDAWEEYEKSLTRKYFIHWDYVILTASNEEQADAYQAQIDARLEAGRLPKETIYRVLPDPERQAGRQRRSHLPCDEIFKRAGRGRGLFQGKTNPGDSFRR